MSEFSNWCRSMFSMLGQGGVWGVPRSGLTFQKRDDKLVLIDRAALPIDGLVGQDWRAYQDDDYELIRREFELAGITVEKEVKE